MAITSERVAPAVPQRVAPEAKTLNAQQVTSIAMAFLKSLGHKRGIKPKHVFIENQRYVVEAEIGKKIGVAAAVSLIFVILDLQTILGSLF